MNVRSTCLLTARDGFLAFGQGVHGPASLGKGIYLAGFSMKHANHRLAHSMLTSELSISSLSSRADPELLMLRFACFNLLVHFRGAVARIHSL